MSSVADDLTDFLGKVLDAVFICGNIGVSRQAEISQFGESFVRKQRRAEVGDEIFEEDKGVVEKFDEAGEILWERDDYYARLIAFL